jgi:iron(II)-dependent oxidoreductase
LLYVPAGVFLMGTTEGDERSQPVHEVELSAFYVAKHETTVAQFERFVRATGYRTTAEKAKDTSHPNVDLTWVDTVVGGTWREPHQARERAPENHPVVRMSWDDAYQYARWAGLDLPTEAQWERAAAWDPRTQHARRYAWGDELPAPGARVGNVSDETHHRSLPRAPYFAGYDDGYDLEAPVGSFPAGQSPCGAFDMTGNVKEWCSDGSNEDRLPAYPSFRVKDPHCGATEAPFKTCRGGSYDDGPASSRCAWRLIEPRSFSYTLVGFRCVRPASETR